MRDSDIEPAWAVMQWAEANGFTFAIEDGKLAVECPEPEELWVELRQQILKHRLMIAKLTMARAELGKERRHG
jgi:hypothetical protein